MGKHLPRNNTRLFDHFTRAELNLKESIFDLSKSAQRLTFTRHLDLQILSRAAFVARTRHCP